MDKLRERTRGIALQQEEEIERLRAQLRAGGGATTGSALGGGGGGAGGAPLVLQHTVSGVGLAGGGGMGHHSRTPSGGISSLSQGTASVLWGGGGGGGNGSGPGSTAASLPPSRSASLAALAGAAAGAPSPPRSPQPEMPPSSRVHGRSGSSDVSSPLPVSTLRISVDGSGAPGSPMTGGGGGLGASSQRSQLAQLAEEVSASVLAAAVRAMRGRAVAFWRRRWRDQIWQPAGSHTPALPRDLYPLA